MKLLARLIFFLLFATPAWAAVYYVSPSGFGSTCSSPLPCTIATAYAKPVVAGDTIRLQDGVYQGATQMLSCSGVNGTSGSPITVEAINDGGATIDGQDARQPLFFTNCDYWVITGINFKRSNEEVAVLTTGADNNTFQRVIFYNGNSSGNYVTVSVRNGATGNLFEDFASFGTGREALQYYNGSGTLNLRRGFMQYSYSTNSNPKSTFFPSYDAKNLVADNLILTQNQQPGANTSQCEGMISHRYTDDGGTGEAIRKVNVEMYGTVAYLPTGESYCSTLFVGLSKIGDFHFTDLAVVVPTGQTKQAVQLQNCKTAETGGSDCAAPDLSITNASLIGGTGDSISAHWTQTNVDSASSVTGIYSGGNSLYINDGTTGATICYRYQNGTLTATPLWPWPMNQRIIDAMTDAGLTSVSVDAAIGAIFGDAPGQCGGGAVEIFPTSLTGTVQATKYGLSIGWQGGSGAMTLSYTANGTSSTCGTTYTPITTVAASANSYSWTTYIPATRSMCIQFSSSGSTATTGPFVMKGRLGK